MTQTIVIGYGKANYATKSASWLTMGVRKITGKPYVTFALNTVYGKRPNRVGRYNCGTMESNGNMYQETIENFPDNVTIAIITNVNSRGMALRNGVIYVRTRADGPSLVIKGKMLMDSQATLIDMFALFIGRGDILTMEEVKSEFTVPRYVEKKFRNPTELAECYDISVIDVPYKAPPKVTAVKSIKGEVKKVAIQAETSRKVVRRKWST